MSELQNLAVNPTQHKSLLQTVVPRPPLRTSDKLQWNKIHVQHHLQPAWETSEHCMTQHVVVVHHSRNTVQSERLLDGRRQKEQLGDGEIVIIPANVQHQLSWDGEGDFSLLMFEPTYIAQIAYESVEAECFELVPRFAMFDPLIYQIGLTLKSELESDNANSRLYAESMAMLLAAHLLQHYSVWEHTIRDYANGLPKRKFHQVIDFMNAHLTEELSLEALATLVQMSSYHFIRSFKQSTGLTPHQYLRRCRIERAEQLLAKQDLTIAQICQQTGFRSPSHFSAVFRKHTGMSPKAYREQ